MLPASVMRCAHVLHSGHHGRCDGDLLERTPRPKETKSVELQFRRQRGLSYTLSLGLLAQDSNVPKLNTLFNSNRAFPTLSKQWSSCRHSARSRERARPEDKGQGMWLHIGQGSACATCLSYTGHKYTPGRALTALISHSGQER